MYVKKKISQNTIKVLYLKLFLNQSFIIRFS